MSERSPAAARATALRLAAETPEDLLAISAHWQDALLRRTDIVWRKPQRQFVFAASRVCWEQAGRRFLRRGVWRVQSLLHVRAVLRVQQKRMDRESDDLLSLLALLWEAGRAPAGSLRAVFSGGAELRLEVEALDVAMQDYGAPWRGAYRPRHPA